MSKSKNKSIFITQVQVDQRPQNNSRHTETDRSEGANSSEYAAMEDNLLNRTPTLQVLIPTTDKWDLMNLKSFFEAKITVNCTETA